MTFKIDMFPSGLWASIREGLLSIVFAPNSLLKPIESMSQSFENLERIANLNTDVLIKHIPLKYMLKPEDHYQRLNLRLLVGLPLISQKDESPDNIVELGGCVSWISKNKIDVTELIREIRDS